MDCKFKEKLVSVIMTAYNTEEYIEEAIQSILNQTYTNYEFIIIDDGSTDGTFDVIMKYARKDDRIIVIKRKNIGLAQSLNDGVRIARGEYIARMDSDDICAPERFEKQVKYLNEHPDVFMLGSNYYIIYGENLSEECRKKYEGSQKRGTVKIDDTNVFLSVSESQKFMHASVMLRKEFYEITGLYEDYMSEDIEITFRAAAKGLRIAKLEEELYGYRAREESKSYVESRKGQSEGIINAKLDWLLANLDENLHKVRFYIWGADVSGEVAKDLLQQRLKNATCLGFVDPMKVGTVFCDCEVISPEQLKEVEFDYVFICTQAGAVMSRQFLKDIGKKEIYDYFKLS